jgi:hypothetical protein
MLIQSNAELTKFRHADAAKLKSTLEGVEKGHAIAMDELNQQLRKSLAENATLERQLKDRENQGKKKDKEIADLRKAAADFEKRREGFNEVLHHFQDNLLGTTSYNLFFNFCYAVRDASYSFRHAASLGQSEVDTAEGLRMATDAARKELDGLLSAGRQACGSLQIAGSSNLSAIALTQKLLLVPGLVADWKLSSARGGARTALTLAKAHYPEMDLDQLTSGIPESGEDGAPVDEAAIRQSVLGYDQLCALGTQLNVYYEAYELPASPSQASASASAATAGGDGGDEVSSKVPPSS